MSALRAHQSVEQESVGALVQRLGTDVTRIVRAELALIQLRVSQALQAFKTAGLALGAGLVLGLAGCGALTAGLVMAVATLMPVWAAAFVVGGGLVVLATIILVLDVRMLNRGVGEALAPVEVTGDAHGG